MLNTHVPLQIGSHIKRRVQELGHGCAALVTKAGALQCSPSDAYTKKELIESARKVSEKVSGPKRERVAWEGWWVEPCILGATMLDFSASVINKCDVQVWRPDVLMMAGQGRLIYTMVAAQGSPNQFLVVGWW